MTPYGQEVVKHFLLVVIHPNQSGLIVGRETRNCSVRAIQLINWAHTHVTPSTISSAFYRWPKATQTSKAQVKVNSKLSKPLYITNGKRQGCPLSSYLFTLTQEDLLSRISANPNIHGVTIGTVEHKL